MTKRFHNLRYVLICLFAACFSQAGWAKTLTIGADIWCPINCDPQDEKQGIGIDLARKIFEPYGYEIRYVVIPWSRALEEVRAGKLDAVVGATHADDESL